MGCCCAILLTCAHKGNSKKTTTTTETLPLCVCVCACVPRISTMTLNFGISRLSI